MLPAKNRLKIRERRGLVWRDKKEVFTPYFKMVYRFEGFADSPKIGFVVSGKTGKAVQRNRIRRLLSEGVRAGLEKFPKGIQVLIIASKNARDVSYEEICTCLDKTLSKIRLPSH